MSGIFERAFSDFGPFWKARILSRDHSRRGELLVFGSNSLKRK
jgi:hypothetical protein